MARRRKADYGMGTQATTAAVSAPAVLQSRPFQHGFNEVRQGKRFDDSQFPRGDQAWHYERGRLFAAVYRGQLRADRKLTLEAKRAFIAAIECGDII